MSLAFFVCLCNLLGTDAAFTGSFKNILWQGGFESGANIRAEYDEVVGNPPPGRTVITQASGGLEPRCGQSFLAFNLDGSDIAHNHNRNEIGFHPTDQVGEKMDDTVRYYGWSMAHDAKKPLSSGSTYELAYWEAKTVWRQTIGFYISDGRTLKLRTRGDGGRTVGSFDFAPGRWHDFVMGIKWSGNSQGWVQLWKDGKEVVRRTSHKTLVWTGNPSFSHLGVFRIPKVNTAVKMYYDCAVYAKSYDPSTSGGCYDDSKQMGSCAGGLRRRRSGPPAAVVVKCSDNGKSCLGTLCCNKPGHKCYEKDQYWAMCKTSCTPGKQASDAGTKWHTPWTCKVVDNGKSGGASGPSPPSPRPAPSTLRRRRSTPPRPVLQPEPVPPPPTSRRRRRQSSTPPPPTPSPTPRIPARRRRRGPASSAAGLASKDYVESVEKLLVDQVAELERAIVEEVEDLKKRLDTIPERSGNNNNINENNNNNRFEENNDRFEEDSNDFEHK